MNPVFADRLGTQDQYDGSGRVVQVATAPGALPHVPNPPGTTIPRPPAAEPVGRPVFASIPLPERAPPEPAQPVLRGTNTEVAAKPKAPAETRAPVTVAKAAAPARSSASASAAEESGIRTAYSAPPASNNGMLAGAQPVVPAGTFAGRWYGLR
jgi:hypothetical protein